MTETQRAFPMLCYEDVGTAVDWITRAYGFREVAESRHTEDDGTVTHAEIELDGATVMLGHPGPEYRGPDRHVRECEQARRWLEPPYVIDGVVVYVDEVDAHHARTVAAGARVLSAPESAPYGRFYATADCEGHRWMFMTP